LDHGPEDGADAWVYARTERGRVTPHRAPWEPFGLPRVCSFRHVGIKLLWTNFVYASTIGAFVLTRHGEHAPSDACRAIQKYCIAAHNHDPRSLGGMPRERFQLVEVSGDAPE